MSTLRYDPAQRPGPMGMGHAIRPTAPERPDHAGPGSEMPREVPDEATSVLSVVVPAKDEASSLPQLVDEIARALRFLSDGGGSRRLARFEIIVVDDGSPTGRLRS